jgi:DNA-directed RNA polymerase alpha subunit
MPTAGTPRTCPQGHKFRKSSDCPTCPQCEAAKKPTSGFLAGLSAPTFRALQHEGLTTLKKLATRTEKEVLALHGVGPASLPALRAALKDAGLTFRTDSGTIR